MKFLSFLEQNEPRLGLLKSSGEVVDLTTLLANSSSNDLPFVPTNIDELIRLGDQALDVIQKCLEETEGTAITGSELAEVHVVAPLNLKKNVICVGRNYRDHIIEGNLARGKPADLFPTDIEFFTKLPTAVIAHGDQISRHADLTNSLDYEVELAIVIGRRGKDISRDEALDYVFGYTIVNDVTARDLQQRHGQWFKGKALDATCPMGPVVVHRSAISNANDLDISLTVNGELRQSDNTSSMIFDVPAIIEQLSSGITLEPGDVIATGTPKGVGFAMDPPACLRSGDIVSATVQRIGTLTNTVSE